MKSTISMDQWRELLDRETHGDFGEEGLGADVQWFADNWQIVRGLRTGVIMLMKPVGLPTTYNCSLGLRALIERAVGDRNIVNINPSITQERFSLRGTGIVKTNCRVEPFLSGETGKQAAKRLTAAGHILADTGDLAGFLHDHPEEVEKFNWVVALAETARWARSDGDVVVPYAHVDGAGRNFFVLDNFRDHFCSLGGVLVRCELDTQSL